MQNNRSYRSSGLNHIWAIMAVNLLLFIATIISRNLVFNLLGLTPALFFDRPWTILTNIFVHSGLWHILANMMTLYFFGSYVSRLMGQNKFLMVYFGGGILGNIFYILLGPPFIPAVGASGAIFALAGVLVIMIPKLRIYVFPIPIPLPLWVAVIGGFFILSLFPFVAWQAHLGGLILGLITGYFFKKRARRFFTL